MVTTEAELLDLFQRQNNDIAVLASVADIAGALLQAGENNRRLLMSLEESKYGYKLAENRTLSSAITSNSVDVNEAEMCVRLPFAAYGNVDGVFDILDRFDEYGQDSILTDRHRLNPLAFFDHQKNGYVLPIGLCSTRDGSRYTVELDGPENDNRAYATIYFYRGGQKSLDAQNHQEFCLQLFSMMACKPPLVRSGSFSYQILSSTPRNPGQRLRSVRLIETSVVLVPANHLTVMSSKALQEDPIREALSLDKVAGSKMNENLRRCLEPYCAPHSPVINGFDSKALKWNREGTGLYSSVGSTGDRYEIELLNPIDYERSRGERRRYLLRVNGEVADAGETLEEVKRYAENGESEKRGTKAFNEADHPRNDNGEFILKAFAEADQGRNFTHLGELRRRTPNLSREEFDTAIQQLRREGRMRLSAAEGRHGITEADRQAGIQEGGELLLHASRSEPQPNDEEMAALEAQLAQWEQRKRGKKSLLRMKYTKRGA